MVLYTFFFSKFENIFYRCRIRFCQQLSMDRPERWTDRRADTHLWKHYFSKRWFFFPLEVGQLWVIFCQDAGNRKGLNWNIWIYITFILFYEEEHFPLRGEIILVVRQITAEHIIEDIVPDFHSIRLKWVRSSYFSLHQHIALALYLNMSSLRIMFYRYMLNGVIWMVKLDIDIELQL